MNDIWEYNGSNWTQITSVTSPLARDAHAMSYDNVRGKTVLFGGYGSSYTALNDTWEYDGVWQQVTTAQSPSARFHHSMAFDTNRNITLLFGGKSLDGQYLGDTWEFNGVNWTKVTPVVAPPARENHSITYDQARGVIIMFGGYNSSGLLNDTWEFDGTTWKQVDTYWGPSARNEMSLVFDSKRNKAVLFGGGYWTSYDTLITFGDTWEYSEESVASQINKKVFVIILDPLLSNGETLIDYLDWNDPDVLTQGTINFFNQVSDGKVKYTVVDTYEDNSGWPTKVDGFTYTETDYLAAIRGEIPFHSPDAVDYNILVNDPDYDICGKANRGEIDEVWIYNGPGFGFYESTLVGPGSFWFNSPPVPGPFSCNVLVPIMGPSPERGLDSATENFGHRTESTMTRVYGSWQQNSINHSWEKFALVDYLSPSFTYSGCGNIHYPPNGTSDYDYSNPSTAQTNCLDFENYPNLSDPSTVLQSVTCSAWNCSHLEYFRYWFGHLPSNSGCGPDNVANNWWIYFSNPVMANNPSTACQRTLNINYGTGSPGSYFTLTGYFFPPNSQISIHINGISIASSITTSSTGDLRFTLDTASADIGFYSVNVSDDLEKSTIKLETFSEISTFELSPVYPYRELSTAGVIIQIPSGIAVNSIFLPLVRK